MAAASYMEPTLLTTSFAVKSSRTDGYPPSSSSPRMLVIS